MLLQLSLLFFILLVLLSLAFFENPFPSSSFVIHQALNKEARTCKRCSIDDRSNNKKKHPKQEMVAAVASVAAVTVVAVVAAVAAGHCCCCWLLLVAATSRMCKYCKRWLLLSSNFADIAAVALLSYTLLLLLRLLLLHRIALLFQKMALNLQHHEAFCCCQCQWWCHCNSCVEDSSSHSNHHEATVMSIKLHQLFCNSRNCCSAIKHQHKHQ